MSPKEYAFFLLKFRLRSEHELYTRLQQKKFPEKEIKKVILFLKEKRFIDDPAFARAWVDARMKKPLGLGRIRQELARKGLDQETIEDALAGAKEQYDESQIVGQLARQRFSKLKSIEPFKAKARVYGYLLRRGFSPDIIREAVGGLD